MNVPNQSVSLRLIKAGENDPEILYLNAANNKWRSPGEGWLGPQAGVWTQLADGVHIMDPAGKDELAFCKKLVFDTCYTLDNGSSTYAFSGGAGKWEVLGIFQ